MERRRFLALLGTVGAGGLAGCTGRLPTFDENMQFPPAARDAEFDPQLDASPAERVDIGSRFGVLRPANNGPHAFNVWNDGPDREITVSVYRNSLRPFKTFERAFDVDGDTHVALTLHRPANYTAVVAAEDSQASTVGVARSNFDCNESATTVAIRENGQMESSTWSTTMGCGPF
ncbi:hypothetical protein AUR64_08060 [Haloprofundus marisrubri]|uniref:Uncharacterized protein n=1 Tax=Haloprofundus marisrubri TaxID=1514971 RepID=A0A0W1RB83_9EURY|nr:hypothetical protein [Haloprofundus marisrubri]KTG10610.1 hypothetical protein AUR64_08060 [Haloprofundus marisrubri]